MFKLEIETGNAAFERYPLDEIARILRDAADSLEGGVNAGKLYDENGNSVGSFKAELQSRARFEPTPKAPGDVII